MTSLFEYVGMYPNAMAAGQIRSILDERGITAFVEGEHDASFAGITTTGGVRLYVHRGDAIRAAQVIREMRDEPEIERWFCGACQVEVDAGFAACWSCGSSKQDAEQPFPEPASINEQFHEATTPKHYFDPANPYAATATASHDPSTAQLIDEQAEAMLHRAYRAAFIGIVSLFVLNFYSIYLLLKASVRTNQFTAQGRRYFYYALALNLCSGIIVGIVCFFA